MAGTGAALLAGAPLRAQNWRTITDARQRQAVDTLRIRVQYGAGKLNLASAPESLLYNLRLHFDADQVRPTPHYDPATQTLTVSGDSNAADIFSFRRHRWHLASHRSDHPSDLTLAIARNVPLDLSLELGATDARIDLSDLTISHLRFEAGASDSRLTFGTPNPGRIAELDISTGAADVTVSRLGNAHADVVRVGTHVGGADLDLSGAWTGEITIRADVALGGLTIRVPRDVGVEARVSKTLGGFDTPAGMTKRDGAFYSTNWNQAKRKLILDGSATMAGIELVWIE